MSNVPTTENRDAAKEALIRFDRILRNTEQKGVKVIKIEDLRKKFDLCLDKFEVHAAQMSAWDMDLL